MSMNRSQESIANASMVDARARAAKQAKQFYDAKTNTYKIPPEQLDLFSPPSQNYYVDIKEERSLHDKLDPVLGGEPDGTLEATLFALLAVPVVRLRFQQDRPNFWSVVGSVNEQTSGDVGLEVKAWGSTLLSAVRELLSISQLYTASKSIQKQQALSAETGSSP